MEDDKHYCIVWEREKISTQKYDLDNTKNCI